MKIKIRLIRWFYICFGIWDDERRYQAHREGKECDMCCIHITQNGRLIRTVRSILFECKFDIPEKSNKRRI